jgi:hypothetical protein
MNVVNGSYDVQEGFYGYTDQGNIPQSPHNNECEPPGLPDVLYNAYDVAHPHNTSLANNEWSYPKNEAYDALEHFDSPYSPHDNAYHTHDAQADNNTWATDDELQIEGNGTLIGSPHCLNSEFAFYTHSEQYPNITTHFRILFHIFAAHFAFSQLIRTSEAHFGNFRPISDLRSLFWKLRIYFGPPKLISETSHL